ncbi:Disulfide bond formation protein B [Candidatus Hepatincola sp. Av]
MKFYMPIKKFLQKPLLFLQVVITLLLLAVFLLEFFYSIHPCPLCLIQRIILIIVLLVALLYSKKILILLGLIANIGVSLYQILLQYNILQGTCKINLSETVLPSCNTIDISFFSISLAGYSFIITIVLFLFMLIYYQPKHGN